MISSIESTSPLQFNHPNYDLIKNDLITRKEGAVALADESDLLNEISRFVQAKMTLEFNFETIIIPDDDCGVSTSILVTSDWLVNTKLLIIVQNAVVCYFFF